MINLAGKRALVTGGSRGIGRAVAELLAACGADVAITYQRNSSAASAVVGAIEAQRRTALAIQADFANPDAPAAVLERVGRAWGSLDFLVNNAGVWEPTPIIARDDAQLQRLLQINFSSAVGCIQASLTLLGRSSSPAIVNISSTAGQRGEAGYSIYASTKSALIGLTKSLAVELGPHIRVNAVAPGWVDTDATVTALGGPDRAQIVAAIPLQRIPTPADLAGPVVFLCSDWARHITGEVLNVNGGSVLCG